MSSSEEDDDDDRVVLSSSPAKATTTRLNDRHTTAALSDDDSDDEQDEHNGDDDDDDHDDNDNDDSLLCVRFLLPDDAECRAPWSLQLNLAKRLSVRAVKDRLCKRLKLSNAARFQLQLPSGLFVRDTSLPLSHCFPGADRSHQCFFVVRRDDSQRLHAAVAERLSMLLTPRGSKGGTTSSIDDDDDTVDSHAVVAAPATTTTTTVAAAAPTAAAASITSDSTTTPRAVVSSPKGAPASAGLSVSARMRDGGVVGVLVEFVFPPGLATFGNLQKKSMRSLPNAPISAIKKALVAKCVPTAADGEQDRLAHSIELQSITGVLFRDNDTLSENFFLDQHCVVTLVVREVPPRPPPVPRAQPAQPEIRKSPTREVVRVRQRRRDKGDGESPRSAQAASAVPLLDLSDTSPVRRSDNSHQKNSDHFPKALSARTMLHDDGAVGGAGESRATVVAVFHLPPSEAFHGLEKKLMAIGAFDSAGAIVKKLFEAIRCQSNADDYELRTSSSLTTAAELQQPKSPRRLAAGGGSRSSPRRSAAGPLLEMAQALERDGGCSRSLGPGESYFDASGAEPLSPRRVTGRAFSGHVFSDSERLADFFKMDHFEGIELELVARGSTFKPLAVTNIPTDRRRANSSNEPTPTSLAASLSLSTLSAVVPVDDILAGRKKAVARKLDVVPEDDALSSAEELPRATSNPKVSYVDAIRVIKAEREEAMKLKSPRSAAAVDDEQTQTVVPRSQPLSPSTSKKKKVKKTNRQTVMF
jgi:hypothetical protein